jgi:hypothetical protein
MDFLQKKNDPSGSIQQVRDDLVSYHWVTEVSITPIAKEYLD